MMEDNMKTDLVLGAKYRVVKGGITVVGTLTEVELDTFRRASGVTDFTNSCLELTEETDGWRDSYTARINGPWDLIEPVTD